MNIVHKLTLRHMALNKRRTLVTLMGVIISVAMITAVATTAASFLNWMQRITLEETGDWQARYELVYPDALDGLRAYSNARGVFLTQDVGVAEFPESPRTNRPYWRILGVDSGARTAFRMVLTQGRWPERPGEIVLSAKAAESAPVTYALGATLELQVGWRERLSDEGERVKMGDREGYWGDEESLTGLRAERYTVVGYMEQPVFEASYQAYYTAVTYLEEAALGPEDTVNAWMQLKQVTRSVYGEAYALAEKLHMQLNDEGRRAVTLNEEYLTYCGVTKSNAINDTLYQFGGILMLIILFGSVSLIYNAFAISISERSRHLGMMASVGATARQKRSSVYFEGAMVGLVSIPLGILFGTLGMAVTFACINPMLSGMFRSGLAGKQQLSVVVSLPSVALAVVVSVITIWISMLIPARRAARISPIDAIRQTQDIKLKARQVRTSRLVRWVFGFPGELALKNLKRNRGRYRATVFSLAGSVVLFLTVNAFLGMMGQSMELASRGLNYDVAVSAYGTFEGTTARQLLEQVAQLPEVERCTIARQLSAELKLPEAQATEALIKMSPAEQGTVTHPLGVMGMDDASFVRYAAEVGCDGQQLLEEEGLSGILVDTVSARDGYEFSQVQLVHMKPGDALSAWAYGESGEPQEVAFTVRATTGQLPMGCVRYSSASVMPYLIVSEGAFEQVMEQLGMTANALDYILFANAQDSEALSEGVELIRQAVKGEGDLAVNDVRANRLIEERMQMMMMVFVYGFVSLISLICVANIVNTISTSIALRTREFAMLKSVGMEPKAFNRMIQFESLFYGIKALLYGLPVSVALIYWMHQSLEGNFSFRFSISWTDLAIAVGGVFILVSITMLYSSQKVRRANIIDALKQENL